MTHDTQTSKSTTGVSKPSYSVQGQYWPGRFGFAWSGTGGTLEVIDKSLVFSDSQQNKTAIIPFRDIKTTKFDFGKRDYLKLQKVDGTRCFFALSASGNANQRTANYNILDQILKQNNVGVDVALMTNVNKGVSLQRFFLISYFFRKRN